MGSVLAGFGFSLALIVAIGAQNAFVLRQGLRREHVLPVVAICVAADATLMTAGIAGLGAALTATPAVLVAVRWGGVAFLLGYAVLAARRAVRPAALTPLDRPPATLRATLLACLAFTFLNPHVYLDTVVLLGTVAHQDPNRWAFGVGAATASLTWFTGLGLGARRLGPLLARPAAWQVVDGTIAVIMVAVAASVAVG
ncbi:LysE/ArgO family amino acid transporter [Micromonospora sp. NBC_00421]|uniref:LysE/ArgO family amino acid transporter n=1 Tax=Micromonospora sp. NBC_00421 TaxID=2975976 RepID=UPI002E1B2A69